MKKNLCIFLLTFISLTTFGQVIPKGTRFIGGDLNFNYLQGNANNTITNNSFQFGITPSFTDFIKDNFAITYSIGYNINISGNMPTFNDDLIKSGSHTITTGVFLRNYKMISEKLGVSVQYGGNIDYMFTTNSVSKSAGVQSINLNLSAGPGIIYLLNEKFAIEGTATLVNFHVGNSWLGDANVFNIGTGLSGSPGLGIGFRYFLK